MANRLSAKKTQDAKRVLEKSALHEKAADEDNHEALNADSTARHAAEQSDGNPGLPDLEPEPVPEPLGDLDCTEEQQGDEDADDITFTDQDRKDFPVLEQSFHKGKRQGFAAIREIRCRRLWKLILDERGQRLYQSFDQYVEERWGHTRQWVTHGTNWLRITEEMESLGITDPPHLSVKAAQALTSNRLKDAGGLRAVLEEARSDGVPFDRDHLREILDRRADFFESVGGDVEDKPAAETYEQFKKDVAAWEQLGEGRTDYSIADEAKELDGDFADNLVRLCQQKRVRPGRDELLHHLTGFALADAIVRLNAISEASTGEEGIQAVSEEQEDCSSVAAKEPVKKAATPRKDNRKSEKASPTNLPSLKFVPPDEAEPADETVTGNDTIVSDVRQRLADALESLKDAFAGDWPEEDAEEFDRILTVAQDCEDKLAEITAKAKEHFADVEEPEAIPGE